jgi:CO/xanthine dehydrogenase FAD-binding subunit
MSRFPTIERYCAPETLDELFSLLGGPGTRVFAGGTDVLVAMKEKGLAVNTLVDLKRVRDLNGIMPLNGSGLAIGATTSLHDIETSPIVNEQWPVLCESVGTIGSFQIRNRGTIGGNLANASPAADSTPALIVLDSQFELLSAKGSRVVPADEFFLGPGQCVLQDGEILRRVIVPTPKPNTHSVYIKFGPRNAMDIAIVGVAVSLRLADDGRCVDARVALASVAPVPLRAHKTETVLVGELSENCINQAAETAAGEARPIDDIRGSAKYRKHLVKVLLRQAVRQAIAGRKISD